MKEEIILEDIGKIWPGWVITQKIGEGGFGVVYRIEKHELNQTYVSALKIISIPKNKEELYALGQNGEDEQSITAYYTELMENLHKEIDLMEEFKGISNIVSYEDHETRPHEDGSFGWDIYIKMELLTPLPVWNREHPLDSIQTVALGTDICRALTICHGKGVIHRDIKPANIFINRHGIYKLGDFGIARTLESTSSVMSQKGTYPYMAPEVFQGRSYGIGADIYSLGLVLYRYLNNNREPFAPDGTVGLEDREKCFSRRISGEPIPAPANGSDALKKTVLKAVAYNPQDRFHSAQEFSDALQNTPEGRNRTQEDSVQKMYGVNQADQTVNIGPSSFHPAESFEENVKHANTDKPTTDYHVSEEPKKHPVRKWIIPAVAGVTVGIIVAAVALLNMHNSNNTDSSVPSDPVNEADSSRTTEKQSEQKIQTTEESEDSNSDSNIHIPSDAREYNGHSYKVYTFTGSISWDTARKSCEENGGYLATINTREENDWLFNYVKEANASYSSTELSAYFGLYNNSSDENYSGGNWQWADGEEFDADLASELWFTNSSNSKEDEPRNLSGREHYGLFYWNSKIGSIMNEKWFTGDFGLNSETGYVSYICEWDTVK